MNEYEKVIFEAHQLCDFFTGTYAEDMLTDALNTHNKELLELVVKELKSRRQQIEEEEAKSENQSD